MKKKKILTFKELFKIILLNTIKCNINDYYQSLYHNFLISCIIITNLITLGVCTFLQEQPGEEKDKELDDDEDRRNPAYVPRRGAFYEHDTRITEDTEKEQQRLA